MTSPCINICHLNDNDICVGCFRSSTEIMTWKDLDDEARKAIERSLLRYCELDTLAMVMIVQAWQEFLNNKQ